LSQQKETSVIEYRENCPLAPEDVARVFESSGLSRPTKDLERLTRMLAGANLTISAWDGARLVGLARALTDHSFCCYLSDLAVDSRYQEHGIGRGLIGKLREALGEEVMLVLLSVPEAIRYYPKLGFEPFPDAFILRRVR
jgi:GNAT superfamily N-acetyltransferase